MESISWNVKHANKVQSPTEALKPIKRGGHIFIGSGAASPQLLIQELITRAGDFVDMEIVHLLTIGNAPYVDSQFKHSFRHNAFFVGPNVREAVSDGRADYTPIFLSEIPGLFKRRRFHIDVALIQVTPPDSHGFCSLGVSVDIVKSAAENADLVIAEVNPRMPRTLGDCFIHVDRIDTLVENNTPIPEFRYPQPDDVAIQIAENVASLIEDGATLQLGIGSIPTAVLDYLASSSDKKDLGIHTEMLTDRVVDVIESGTITNAKKSLHPGKIVCSLVLGTQRLYDFVHQNPFFEFRPSDYVNDPFVIARNDRMVAINAALEVDLTGQVCADSLGYKFYSGIGGQVDFIRGAARSKGGKPIIVIPSTANDGQTSRIVSHLSEGAGVVITRGDIHYVVSEYGVANLHGRNIRERTLALINIAHPNFRQELLTEAKLRHYAFVDQLPPMGLYPSELETSASFDGTEVFFRPIKPTDEPLIQDLFYSLSQDSIYHRFFASIGGMPHAHAQRFTTIDYDKEMAIVGVIEKMEQQEIIAVGRYVLEPKTMLAEVALLVRDDLQSKGIGTWLQNHMIGIAKSRGVVGFTARVMRDNIRVFNLAHKTGFTVETTQEDRGIYLLTYKFK